MQGAGNDYVYVDGFSQKIANPERVAQLISDRHFGVGGDGLILVLPPETPEGDARMRMFNADGTEAEMCGNGVRCVAKFAADHRLVPPESSEVRVETLAGIKVIGLIRDSSGQIWGARVDMGPPRLHRGEVPMEGIPEELAVGVPLFAGDREYRITALSMGNPHCVVFLPSVAELDLPRLGPLFECHPAFPQRVNTEFCRVIDRSNVEMRVWERGSGETLACGTGASAVVVAAHLNGLTERKITIRLRGGELELEWAPDGRVYLTGPAVEVFTGNWTFPEESDASAEEAR